MDMQHWRLVAAACGIAAACGSSVPEQPLAPSGRGAFTGTWAPTVRVLGCTGSHACIAFDTTSFVMRLAQDGSQVHGTAFVGGASLDVTGTVDPAGRLSLTTSPRPVFTLHELSLRADATVGMTGTIQYTVSAMTVQGQITSAKRGPLESILSTVQGTWTGNSRVRACTYSGWTECPRLARPFRLSLRQSGSAITGDLDFSYDERFRVPVRGAFTTPVLSLDGTAIHEQAGSTYQLRLLTWTSRPDAFGRMSGSFTYEEEFVLGARRDTARYESELEDVYLLPDWLPYGTAAAPSGMMLTVTVDGVPAPVTENRRMMHARATILPLPVGPSLSEGFLR